MYKVIANTDKRMVNPCEKRQFYRAGIIWADLEGREGVFPDPFGLQSFLEYVSLLIMKTHCDLVLMNAFWTVINISVGALIIKYRVFISIS